MDKILFYLAVFVNEIGYRVTISKVKGINQFEELFTGSFVRDSIRGFQLSYSLG